MRWWTGGVLVGVAWSAYDLLRPEGALRAGLPDASIARSWRWLALGVGLLAAGVVARRALTGPRVAPIGAQSAFPLRLLCYAAFLGSLLPTILTAGGFVQPQSRFLGSLFASGAILALALWVIALDFFPALARGPSRPALRSADLIAFNLLAALVLAEGALALTRRLLPTPILYDDSTAEAKIRQFRGRWDGDYNTNGYRDEEFFVAGPRDYVVALVADSFGVGVVPHPNTFAAVAERTLRERMANRYERVAIHNFGVDGIDMPEYVHLLRTEALAMRPRQVVLSLFVGNDIGGMDVRPTPRPYRLQDWSTVRVLWRVQRFLRGLERFELVTRESDARAAGEDPEPPTFTPDVFRSIEANRLEVCNRQAPFIADNYRELFQALDYVEKLVGRGLLVLIVPDEFQVNDELYEAVLATRPDRSVYDRGYPQTRIGAWCRDRGVRCLDPLDALREANRTAPAYWLRDTHWNARGNRVVGEALGESLVAYAER